MPRLTDCHCGRPKIAEEFTMLSGVGPMIKQWFPQQIEIRYYLETKNILEDGGMLVISKYFQIFMRNSIKLYVYV